MSDSLTQQRCLPCEGGVAPLAATEINQLLTELKQWQVSADNKIIRKSFRFGNYYETMAFVNAIAWLSHLENHHPDLLVSYNHCDVSYTTHAIDGLSTNDFICAAKVDAIRAGE